MIRAIVTDIEGTTSSIDFVHQELFPYARRRMREFLRTHAGDDAVQVELHEIERIAGEELSPAQASELLERWIDEDRKYTPLKTLQGMIWREGYLAGELRGHVYADTPEFLRRWHEAGLKLFVYSSGSTEAQRLIFGHSSAGDLRPLFAGYFDTHIGGKRDAASYRRIAERIGLPPQQILFLSDAGAELDAAREAGMATCQLLRDGQAQPAQGHAQARDFSEVSLG